MKSRAHGVSSYSYIDELADGCGKVIEECRSFILRCDGAKASLDFIEMRQRHLDALKHTFDLSLFGRPFHEMGPWVGMAPKDLVLAATALDDNMAFYSWNPLTNDVTWDARFHAMFGMPAGEKPTFELWHGLVVRSDVAHVDTAIARALGLGARCYDITYRMRAYQDGVERLVRTKGVIYFYDGKPVRFGGFIRDISSTKSERDHV
jgi:hypothetical protein